jgi:hypothetical protein
MRELAAVRSALADAAPAVKERDFVDDQVEQALGNERDRDHRRSLRSSQYSKQPNAQAAVSMRARVVIDQPRRRSTSAG